MKVKVKVKKRSNMNNEMVMVLELCDLIDYDRTMGNIVVDKGIFDDFVENSCIDIRFVDDEYNLVYTYIMVKEDDEGIYMELMEG